MHIYKHGMMIYLYHVFCCNRFMLRVYLAVLGIIVTTEGDAKLPKVGTSPICKHNV